MNIYEGLIYPHILEHAVGHCENLRQQLLSKARGDVLEIGFGTGLNLPHYPDRVRSLTALDPNRPLQKLVEQRIEETPFPVVQMQLNADRHLPFATNSFDTIVSTWALCTVPRPSVALEEIRRILKPRGSFIFLEPGVSSDASLARWQSRVSPFLKQLTCGASFNLEIERLLKEAGFRVPKLERFVMDQRPKFINQMYQGIAKVA